MNGSNLVHFGKNANELGASTFVKHIEPESTYFHKSFMINKFSRAFILQTNAYIFFPAAMTNLHPAAGDSTPLPL